MKQKRQNVNQGSVFLEIANAGRVEAPAVVNDCVGQDDPSKENTGYIIKLLALLEVVETPVECAQVIELVENEQ